MAYSLLQNLKIINNPISQWSILKPDKAYRNQPHFMFGLVTNNGNLAQTI